MVERLQVLGKTPLRVASCLVFDEDGKILLLKRHDDDLGGGMWAVPGGKQEPGEESLATVLREVFEESGITLEAADFLGVHELNMPHGTVHMQTFKARVPSSAVVTLDPEEHSAYRWFAVDELLTQPGIIWALPTTLRDFGLLSAFEVDPTLSDGSDAVLLERRVVA